MTWVLPERLSDGVVTLRTLGVQDVGALSRCGNPDVIKYLSRWPESWEAADVERWLRNVMGAANSHFYAVLDERSQASVVGMTAFLDVSEYNRRLEIGWTWLRRELHGTRVNTRIKLLMLTHAFDVLGAMRVMLTCDTRNARSRAAIERIGARYEGTMRSYGRMPDGFQRDVAVFSIVSGEWAEVKPALQSRVSDASQCAG